MTMRDLDEQLRRYVDGVAPSIGVDELRREPQKTRRLVPALAGAAVVLAAIAVVFVPSLHQSPAVTTTPTTPSTVPPRVTTTTDESSTSTAPSAEVPLDLTENEWVIAGPLGLITDDGTELWSSISLGDRSVARDNAGGLVFLDAGGLWWFQAGSTEPVLVARDVPGRIVEVIGSGRDGVVKLGYGPPIYIRLADGRLTTDPGGDLVTVDANGQEVWSAANGWSVWLEPATFKPDPEGPATEVLTLGRLKVADSSGSVVVDVPVGSTAEPALRINDFDGQHLILSQGPVEPAMPEETYFEIDLGCRTCTQVFTAGGSWASLTGVDGTWNGPLDFSDASPSTTTTTMVAPIKEVPVVLGGSADGASPWQEVLTIPYGELDSELGFDALPQVGPDFAAIAPDGSWWVIDSQKDRIAVFDAAGRFTQAFDIGRANLQFPMVLDDGTFVAMGLDQVLTIRDDEVGTWPLSAGFSPFVGVGSIIYGRSEGGLYPRLSVAVGGASLESGVEWLRDSSGSEYSVDSADETGEVAIVFRGGSPVRVQLVPHTAADPNTQIGVSPFGLVSAENGTITLLLLGAEDGATVAALVSFAQDGTLVQTAPLPAAFFDGQVSPEFGYLVAQPGTGILYLVTTDASGLHIYRLAGQS
jgi:hypothetical protein